jgi:superfamily I DNA/RNA helicase
VAITRAKDQLYLISPSIKYTYRGPQMARISQFISELDPKVFKKSTVQFKSRKKKGQIDKTDLFKSAIDLL